MGELRPWHIVVIVVVAFILFGYKKLPDATRSLGRSLRILKTEVKTLHDDDSDKKTPAEAPVSVVKEPAEPRAVEAAEPVAPAAPVATSRVVQAPRVVEAPRATVPTVPTRSSTPADSEIP